jgi:hypothetical protein
MAIKSVLSGFQAKSTEFAKQTRAEAKTILRGPVSPAKLEELQREAIDTLDLSGSPLAERLNAALEGALEDAPYATIKEILTSTGSEAEIVKKLGMETASSLMADLVQARTAYETVDAEELVDEFFYANPEVDPSRVSDADRPELADAIRKAVIAEIDVLAEVLKEGIEAAEHDPSKGANLALLGKAVVDKYYGIRTEQTLQVDTSAIQRKPPDEMWNAMSSDASRVPANSPVGARDLNESAWADVKTLMALSPEILAQSEAQGRLRAAIALSAKANLLTQAGSGMFLDTYACLKALGGDAKLAKVTIDFADKVEQGETTTSKELLARLAEPEVRPAPLPPAVQTAVAAAALNPIAGFEGDTLSAEELNRFAEKTLEQLSGLSPLAFTQSQEIRGNLETAADAAGRAVYLTGGADASQLNAFAALQAMLGNRELAQAVISYGSPNNGAAFTGSEHLLQRLGRETEPKLPGKLQQALQACADAPVPPFEVPGLFGMVPGNPLKPGEVNDYFAWKEFQKYENLPPAILAESAIRAEIQAAANASAKACLLTDPEKPKLLANALDTFASLQLLLRNTELARAAIEHGEALGEHAMIAGSKKLLTRLSQPVEEMPAPLAKLLA